MNRTGSMAWCAGLAAVAVSQLLLVTALIVLPQWRAQQSARRGIVTFFVAGDSSIRLWNRPIDSAVMPGLIRRAEQLDSSTRIRVVLSPGVPGVLFRTLFRFSMKQLSMLSFNSLRQRAPELLAVAIPLGIAVAIHGVWILLGSRAAADPKGSALANGGDSAVVDNTAQLGRITRRASQQTLASVGLI